MQKKLILSAVLGGVLLFVWGFISHGLLSWYESQMRTFTNQNDVESAIVAGVSGSGFYYLPNLTPEQQGLPAEERKAAEAALMERWERGPVAVTFVRIGPGASYPTRLVIQFFIGVLASLLVAWLLLQAGIASYGGRIAFVIGIALVAVIWGKLPDWNWYEVPMMWTLVGAVDSIIAFGLLGALLGRIARPEAAG
jgi:hypothetical protein